jgi:hypothetical protein
VNQEQAWKCPKCENINRASNSVCEVCEYHIRDAKAYSVISLESNNISERNKTQKQMSFTIGIIFMAFVFIGIFTNRNVSKNQNNERSESRDFLIGSLAGPHDCDNFIQIEPNQDLGNLDSNLLFIYVGADRIVEQSTLKLFGPKGNQIFAWTRIEDEIKNGCLIRSIGTYITVPGDYMATIDYSELIRPSSQLFFSVPFGEEKEWQPDSIFAGFGGVNHDCRINYPINSLDVQTIPNDLRLFVAAPISEKFYGQEFIYSFVDSNNKEIFPTEGGTLPNNLNCFWRSYSIDIENLPLLGNIGFEIKGLEPRTLNIELH